MEAPLWQDVYNKNPTIGKLEIEWDPDKRNNWNRKKIEQCRMENLKEKASTYPSRLSR